MRERLGLGGWPVFCLQQWVCVCGGGVWVGLDTENEDRGGGLGLEDSQGVSLNM